MTFLRTGDLIAYTRDALTVRIRRARRANDHTAMIRLIAYDDKWTSHTHSHDLLCDCSSAHRGFSGW